MAASRSRRTLSASSCPTCVKDFTPSVESVLSMIMVYMILQQPDYRALLWSMMLAPTPGEWGASDPFERPLRPPADAAKDRHLAARRTTAGGEPAQVAEDPRERIVALEAHLPQEVR